MPTAVVTAAATYPVSLDEVKAFLRIDHDRDNEVLEDTVIPTAVDAAETFRGQRFITTTLRLDLPDFPDSGTIELYSPLQSVTHVKYYDDSETLQTLSSTYYDTDIVSEPGKVSLAYGYLWPSAYERPDAVQVTYVAGYGDASTDVPAEIRRVIMQLCGWMNDHRYEEVPPEIVRQLWPKRVISL